jgi:hypothetical protein
MPLSPRGVKIMPPIDSKRSLSGNATAISPLMKGYFEDQERRKRSEEKSEENGANLLEESTASWIESSARRAKDLDS